MPKSSPSYKVSLGNTVLNRAKLVFGIGSIVVLLIVSAFVFAETQTHELRNKLATPFQNLANTIQEAMKEEPNIKSNNNFKTTTVVVSTSSSTITVNGQIVTPTPKKAASVYRPTSKPVVTKAPTQVQAPTKSYEQSVAEMNARADAEYQAALKKQAEWSAAKKAENDAWFQQQTQAAQKSQDDWWAQQQANMDAWKKANGF